MRIMALQWRCACKFVYVNEWKDHNAQVCTGPWVSDLVFFQLLTSFLLHGSPSLVLLCPLLLQSSPPLLQLLLIVLPSSLLTRLPLGLLDSWGMVHVDRRTQLAMTWCMCMCVFTCALARTHKKKMDIITWAHTHRLIAAVWWVSCRSCDKALALNTKQIPQTLSWGQRLGCCAKHWTQMHSNENTQTQKGHNFLKHICCGMSLTPTHA